MMGEKIDNDIVLANTFYQHLTKKASKINCQPHFLSYCHLYKDMLFKFLQNFTCSDVIDWNQTVFSLYQIGMLKKIFTFFITNQSSLSDFCLELMPLSKILKDLFPITIFPEISLKHAAQDSMAYLIVVLCRHSHSSFEECLKLFLNLILSNVDQTTCCCIDTLSILLKQFNDLELPDELRVFLLRFYKNHLIKLDFHSELKTFYSTINFVKETLDLTIQSRDMLGAVVAVVNVWLLTIELTTIDCAYQLPFFQIVLRCMKAAYDLNSKQSFDLAYGCLTMTDSLLTKMKAEAQFVGFGGRCDDDESSASSKTFTKAEKINLINIILNAFCVYAQDINKNVVEKLRFTEQFLFPKSKSDLFDRTDQIFNLFFEQDDMLIEFLLLHLTLVVKLESKKIVFLASPHLLFVKLFQNLTFDSSVLLDWLTSNETQFLLYFLKYLKYAARTYKDFSAVCAALPDANMEKSVLDVIRNLKASIEKLRSRNLFPYNVTPLLKVMVSVMALSET